MKVGERVYRGDDFLNIVDLRDGGVNLFGTALERDDSTGLGEFGPELGDDEVGCEEPKTKTNGNTEVLDKTVRTGE